MNAYLRNGIVAVIINVVIFIIGWGCIVPDQIFDNTHLFGLIGDTEIIRGNTAVVFGICSILSTLTMIISLVEAIVEDYRPRFCPTTRNERPRKTPKSEPAGMRITDPSPAKCTDDGDPKTPTLD